MFSIIQSHKTQTLLQYLAKDYSQTLEQGQSLFDEFVVLVPSMVLGDWLQKAIATHYGISTMITTTFWGQYQWRLMQTLLDQYKQQLKATGRASQVVNVPEVAVLSSRVMQWRLFAYLLNQQPVILADNQHPLHSFLTSILPEQNSQSAQSNSTQNGSIQDNSVPHNHQHTEDSEKRLWQLSSDFAKVFNRYLTHRSEWLDSWTSGQSLDVSQMIAEKDRLNAKFAYRSGQSEEDIQPTPEWLVEHYTELEQVQGYLWRLLFAGAYQHRKQIEANFWQAMADPSLVQQLVSQAKLPRCLYLFTLQQLPLSELEFLQRLSQFIDVKLFHYNPSQMFWADIVDKRWLAHQRIINPKHVYLRDYGHSLLSRLGKQSRETFASLASMSGNEYNDKFVLNWHDDFGYDHVDDTNSASDEPLSLLQRLQQDVLMLDESPTAQQVGQQVVLALQAIDDDGFESLLKHKQIDNDRHWRVTYDDSIQIHACHSLQRQLEVLRHRLAYWLNADTSRQLADIVVLLPDVEANEDLIRSVFVDGEGQDGLYLPARITGVVDKSIRQLWQAICGYYHLLGASFARFEAVQVFDWLSLPPLSTSLGLNEEQVARACQLLHEAGFVRGFDEQHLQRSLDNQDQDYRFSFAYALDKLVLGLTMPQADITDCLYINDSCQNTYQNDGVIHNSHQAYTKIANSKHIAEQSIPSSQVTLADAPIIDALCRVYQSLDKHRQDYQLRKSPADWIIAIEEQVLHPLFAVYEQSKEMRAIFKAMNGFRRSLRANQQSDSYYPNSCFSYHTDSAIDLNASHANSDQVGSNQADGNQLVEADLCLGLEFVLESIEAELESQQISAEPTGVITFARFGSLRTVPYPLVVMLNMNLSEFPRQDKNERYDLMKAGLAKRGDRSSEDDDNGAFLDALLCADDSCWIFYNGQSLQDAHEHLPANPVSELLQFLQGEIQWQTDELLEKTDTQELQASVEQYLPKLIESWLVTRHAPLPFSPQIFELPESLATDKTEQPVVNDIKQLLNQRMQIHKLTRQQQIPPNPIWHSLYHRLQTGNDKQIRRFNTVQLLNQTEYQYIAQLICTSVEQQSAQSDQTSYNQGFYDDELFQQLLQSDTITESDTLAQIQLTQHLGLPTHLDIMQLARQVSHPAISYLQYQQVYIANNDEQLMRQEPLTLNALSRYQLNQSLLQQLADQSSTTQNEARLTEHLLFTPIVPAGVARLTSLSYQQRQIQAQLDELQQLLVNNGIIKVPQEQDTQHKNIITPCQEVSKVITIQLFGDVHELELKGRLPQNQAQTWINILANSASGKHLLSFWLSHLYWQIVRETTETQCENADGVSICYFNKANNNIKALKDQQIIGFAPITADKAKAELSKWILFAQLCQRLPIVLMPDYALTYLDKCHQQQGYQATISDYSNWLGNNYFQSTQQPFNSSSKHPVWQYILSGSRDSSDSRPAFNALKLALQNLSEPLFTNIYQALQHSNSLIAKEG